jgi:hypothetical protein
MRFAGTKGSFRSLFCPVDQQGGVAHPKTTIPEIRKMSCDGIWPWKVVIKPEEGTGVQATLDIYLCEYSLKGGLDFRQGLFRTHALEVHLTV